ncbi:MAG: Fe-S-containing protein [Clostridia bacterium]|nr:Fe-S-containing protein [Clostridia bacterium]
MSAMNAKDKYKNIAFRGAVAIALIIIIYFTVIPKNKEDKSNSQDVNSTVTASIQDTRPTANSQNSTDTAQNQKNSTVVNDTEQNAESKVTVKTEPKEESTAAEQNPSPSIKPSNSPQPTKNQQQTNDKAIITNDNNSQSKTTEAKQPESPTEQPKTVEAIKSDDIAIKILKSEITSTAKFYPYTADGTYMEVIAVKAADGSIRTALNTCQVCFDSGKGYYEQVGEFLICQNCRNKFHIDQVEKVKGGCNPVPVMAENKKETEDSIIILKDYMAGQKELFSNWKKQF